MRASALPTGRTALIAGLLIALLGSFADDLLGGSTAASVVQIAFWVVGGVLILSGLFGTVAVRGGDRPSARRPHGAL